MRMFSPTSPICRPEQKAESCLALQLMSRDGTTEALQQSIDSGLAVDERVNLTDEGPLHVLFRVCALPTELFDTTKLLIDSGADLNMVDGRAKGTPLTLLVLHINRGLRYHAFRVPEVERMVSLYLPQDDIKNKIIEYDHIYQCQVYETLKLMLSSGANVNDIAETCPSIPHKSEWSEMFEHKLMQQERRWLLLKFQASMVSTTYNIFNPLTVHRVSNTNKVTTLHLAAWRGDAQCLELLIRHGCDITARAADGRNALHFLYQYCNKPCDLARCTQLLLEAGVSPGDVVLDTGDPPIFFLLRHIHVKYSYIKYLANTYTALGWIEEDYFLDDIAACVRLLVQHGADINQQNIKGYTPLYEIFHHFNQTLENCSVDFQPIGHYLVPYQFRVQPLIVFTDILTQLGAKINGNEEKGLTPLHSFLTSFHSLNLHLEANDATIVECIKLLIEKGADLNIKVGGLNAVMTLMHLLRRFAQSEDVGLLLRVLDKLVLHGGQHEAPLTIVTSLTDWGHPRVRLSNLKRVVIHMLNLGIQPETWSPEGTTLFSDLLLIHKQRCHANRDPGAQDGGGASPSSSALDVSIIHKLLRVCAHSMYQWFVCELLAPYTHPPDPAPDGSTDACHVLRELWVELNAGPRSLKRACKLVIWKSLGPRYQFDCDKLPLPKALIQYVLDLTVM